MLSRTGHVQAAGFYFAVCLFNTYSLTQSTQHINPVTCLPPTIIIALSSRSESWQNLTRFGITADSSTQLSHTEVSDYPFLLQCLKCLKKCCTVNMMAIIRQEGVKAYSLDSFLSFFFIMRGEAQDLSPFISAHNRFQELCFRGAAASYRGTTCFCSPQCFTSRQMRELAGK